MSHPFIKKLTMVSILFLLALPLTAGEPPKDLATMRVASGFVTFEPQISYSGVRVTLSGPAGFEVVEVFAEDQAPGIEIPGDDGFYKYELRFSPVLNAEARAALAAAREAGTEPAELKAGSSESLVQSGAFTIAGGELVADRREVEPKVVLTNGDGVIRNSLCVGFDCPDAPVFSDSTILLMENNTRIKFGDTSAAPFPNVDWEIEANSSLSGGANYLGFNDCGTADNDGGCADDVVFAVEAGARRNALYVESDGDIGIGTSNPVVDIHVVTGNTPTLRLDQDGSSGFTPQVWDVAGNETNFFVRDVTGGSLLPFRIHPGAPTSSIDIATSGNVGVGTSLPQDPVHVLRSGASAPAIRMQNGDNSGDGWRMTVTDTQDLFRIVSIGHGSTFSLDTSGNLTLLGSLTVCDGGTNCSPETSYPDYVFEEGYSLMPLDELAAFIAENKHLPSVPTVEEVSKSGVNMTELQWKLLEKVEELTLYTLKQQDTIEELRQRVRELEGDAD